MLNSTMNFFLLINVKMPTIVGKLLANCWHFNIYEREKIASYAYLSLKKTPNSLSIFFTYEHLNFHAQRVEHENSFITSGPG